MALSTKMRPGDARGQRSLYRPAILLAPALTAGVIGDHFGDVPNTMWTWALAGLLVVWFLMWTARRDYGGSFVLLLAVAAFGGLLHHTHWNLYPRTDLSLGLRPEKQPVALQAVVTDYPRWVPERPPRTPYEFAVPGQWKVPIRLRHLRDANRWVPTSGTADVYVVGEAVQARPGESLIIFAQASRPERALNPGEFDFDRWARGRRQRIFLRAAFAECLTPTGEPIRRPMVALLQDLRHQVAQTIAAVIPAESQGLAETIFLGRRERLAEETDEAFRQTGTVHLLALSGLHLGILAFLSFWLLRWVPGPVSLPGAIMLVLTCGYLLLVDARPPIVRASILVILFCGGQILFRRHSFWNSLAVAWIIVTCWNPTEIFQAGTQLSFVAVASLAWLNQASLRFQRTDPLQKLIDLSRPWSVRAAKGVGWFIARCFIASATVWLVTLPLVMIHFHAVSPWTILLSPILIPFMGLALAGIVLMLGVFLSGGPIAWLSEVIQWPLWVLESVVSATQQNWGVTYWGSGPDHWWVIGFYGILGILGWSMVCRAFPWRWALAVVAVWCGIGFTSGLSQAHAALQRNHVTCTFVSVGHGTCVLLELPGGQNLLYDCGRLGSPSRATQSLAAVLWSKGISHLDAVLISHDDADHFNGIPGILERFSVGTVYCSHPMQTFPSPLAENLLQELDAREIPLRAISGGQRLKIRGDVDLTILHPTRKGVLGSDNANSLVLLLEFRGRRILLPGDLESPGTEAILLEEPIECDVVMAPHHGSRHSNPEEFYAWCQPRWIIVSSGSREIAAAQMKDDGPGGEAQWRVTAATGQVEVRLDSSPNAAPRIVSFWEN